ncbi:flagellar hook-length control protein FliK [Nisaea acidiphila]|uniref:Flagellar hook-length control protein FliK n=1 Tax=Nisaea acidiphila TaxID=1862145 RepID=A0A9J7AUK5_9PROT|nr:flagellar hook-length control protein FliK [Nisaea acidiphila]UUX50506.1 flagellar hook-length control protein FliK [Nisaea acidiphila]
MLLIDKHKARGQSMSPVSTTPDLLSGASTKRASALPFDPIASRNTDRPKFRLEDYARDDVNDSVRAESTRRESSARSEHVNNRHESRRETSPSQTKDRPEDSQVRASGTEASRTPAPSHNETKTVQADNAPASEADAAPASTPEPASTPAKDPKENVAEGSTEAAADSPAAAPVASEVRETQPKTEPAHPDGTAQVAPTQTGTSNGSENGNDNAPSPTPQASGQVNEQNPLSNEKTAPVESSGHSVKKTDETSAAVEKAAHEQIKTASDNVVAGQQKITAATTATSATEPRESNSAKQSPTQTASAPAHQSGDPKLAALQKLTQRPAAEDATAAAKSNANAAASDDKTTLTLPVPWPQKSAAQTATAQTATAGTNGKTTELPADAVARAVRAAAGAANANNQAQKPATETSAPQGTAKTAAPQSGQPLPKIEIEQSVAARQQNAGETALLAANRAAAADNAPKPNLLPSQSETIAAVTALNSRVPRSNALGAAQQSNALNSAAEKAVSQIAANAGQTAVGAIVAGATQSSAPAGGSTTAFTAVQSQPAGTPIEQAAGNHSRGGASQNGLSDSGSTSSGTPRAGEMPSTTTGSSFGDTLRANGSERAANAQEARQPLPGAAAEQVKVKLVKAAQGGLDRIKMQLNPSELGKVEVRLEFGSDGGVRGIVTVEKPETLSLLQRDARQLEQALQDAGFKTGGDSLEFQMRGGDTNGRQQFAGDGNGSLSNAGGDLAADEEQLGTATAGTEQDGIGDDGSLNMVA